MSRIFTHLNRRFFSNYYSHGYELQNEHNHTHRIQHFDALYNPSSELIRGFATPAATAKYASRSQLVHPDNWKSPKYLPADRQDGQLKISSIGIGTYHGDLQKSTDLAMFNAIIDSVESGGVNLIDTCNSYRCSKSERVINAALKYLLQKQQAQPFTRQQLFISTKLGYVAEDADKNQQGSQVVSQMIKRKLIYESDIVDNMHCVHPAFLEYSLETSRANLGLQTIDLVYLNNFAESQKHLIGSEKFWYRLQKAFEFLEKQVQDNKIRYYGIASWSSLRLPHKDPLHLSVDELINSAQKVGGSNHHMRFIQTPINLGMPEAFGETNQLWHEKEHNNETKKLEQQSLLTVAHRYGVNVVACSPLLAGTLINIPLPSEQLKCSYNGAKHLQFIRSIPSPSLLSVLIGQKANRHVKTNLEVVTTNQLTMDEWLAFLRPSYPKQSAEPPV